MSNRTTDIPVSIPDKPVRLLESGYDIRTVQSCWATAMCRPPNGICM